MPPQKRDAAVGGRGAREFDQAGKQINTLSSQVSPDGQELDPIRWVADGRQTLGVIFPAGPCFRAETGTGEDLGQFPTIKSARAAIIKVSADRILERDDARKHARKLAA
jgi:hypothetical protein